MRRVAFVLACAVLLGMVMSVDAQERKIVIFQTTVKEPAREALVRAVGGVIVKDLPLVDGKAVLLSLQAESALGRIPEVVRVDDDILVEAYPKPDQPGGGKPPKEPEPPPAKTLPWGVDRIDAEFAWGFSTGSGVKVGILDTGIDLDHPDLAVAGGYNAINSRKSADDDNGHGTHVAGIVAALYNEIGVVGVAPDARLYAVKVLDRNGSGFLSDVIEGLQWCLAQGTQVVNMSFGSSGDNQTFHDAITAADKAGLIQVAAAGNSGGAVGYPAAYPETIAVSATDKFDLLASWSNYGPEIDLAAPGVDIYSTYKGGGYKTLSGTSMACPHVTGTVVLALALGLTVETGAGLQTTDDLKAEDIKLTIDRQGEGLVDAEDSVNGEALLNGDNLPAGAAKPVLVAKPSTWGQIKSLVK